MHNDLFDDFIIMLMMEEDEKVESDNDPDAMGEFDLWDPEG